MAIKEQNPQRFSPDHLPLNIDWDNILTAITLKGKVAQFIDFFHNTRPRDVLHKTVLDILDTETIEQALANGIEQGFSLGIATCYGSSNTGTSQRRSLPQSITMMEKAPYWAGRSGAHELNDIPAIVSGDPHWNHFGNKIPPEDRTNYPWIPSGLKGLAKSPISPQEIVINHHHQGYGLSSENHFVAQVSRPSGNMAKNLRIDITPYTFNTRALGGKLEQSNTVNLILSHTRRIFIAGHNLFPEDSFLFINKVIEALKYARQKVEENNLSRNQATDHSQDNHYDHVRNYLYDHATSQVETLNNILTIGETADDIISMLFASNLFEHASTNILDAQEAILTFNKAIKDQEQWNRFVFHPQTYRSLVKPQIVAISDFISTRLIQNHSRPFWESVFDSLDENSHLFEPTLEFIGTLPPDNGQRYLHFYEVKEVLPQYLTPMLTS